MTKQDARNIFGRYDADIARAVGLTRQAVEAWPDNLDQPRIDRVIGAALRLGKVIPDYVKIKVE